MSQPHKKVLARGPRRRLPNPNPWTGLANTSIKNDVLALFPEIELIHDPKTNNVHLYRVIRKGATKMDDVLIHEFKLKAPPGPWLLQHLCIHDSYRTLGVGDNRYKKWEKIDEAQDLKEEIKTKMFMEDLNNQVTKEAKVLAKNRVFSYINPMRKGA